jgi:L-arabinonolactonase
MIATLALATGHQLGEGVVWDAARGCWLWTDIEASVLLRWDGSSAAPERHALPDRLGSLAPTRSGRLLLGLAKGLAWGDFVGDGLQVTPLVPVDAAEPRTRINDGRTDRSGNFVFGTFNEAADRRPIGSFYQYSARHGLRRLALPAVTIANSICFSPDGGTMYFADSPNGLIQQCRYDANSAEVGPPRPFAKLPAPGGPDGSVVDAEGCLWNAQWGLGRVQRYASSGELLERVALPVPHVSCPGFGGADLGTLLITTARVGLSPQALAGAPLSGALFCVKIPGYVGLADAPFDDDLRAPTAA